MRWILVLIIACQVCLCAEPALSSADAASAGMNARKLSEIPARMREFVDAHTVSGVVTIVARHGKVVEFDAVGLRDIESQLAMQKDTLFRVASLTKPVTCAAIMILADEGRLSPIDAVEKYLPEYKGLKMNPCRAGAGLGCQAVMPHRPINLEDLMTHTSGLPSSAPEGKDAAKSLAELVSRGAHSELLFEPGTSWNYSNLGMDILGRIVEIVSGKTFDQFLKERIFDPLGMKDTGFVVAAENRSRMAVLYNFGNPTKPQRMEAQWGESGAIPSPAGGLVSTAADMLRFNEMMRNHGSLGGQRILSPAAAELMSISHTGEMSAGWVTGVGHGYGYEVVRNVAGRFRYNSIGTFEKGGAYRTYEFVDPKLDLSGVIMMQRTNGGSDSSDEINAFIALASAAVETP